jgi:hypothetical protein
MSQKEMPADAYGPDEKFLAPDELEARWGAVAGYTSELRSRGDGPRFVRLSPRVIRYPLSEVRFYELANLSPEREVA